MQSSSLQEIELAHSDSSPAAVSSRHLEDATRDTALGLDAQHARSRSWMRSASVGRVNDREKGSPLSHASVSQPLNKVDTSITRCMVHPGSEVMACCDDRERGRRERYERPRHLAAPMVPLSRNPLSPRPSTVHHPCTHAATKKTRPSGKD